MRPLVTVKPELLQWACRRIPVDPEVLHGRFPKYAEWEKGTLKPALQQMKDFAQFTRVPIAALFVSEPMEESMPIRDLRTGNQKSSQPSSNLLDAIYMCQQRQGWFQRYTETEEHDPIPFVGSATLDDGIKSTAEKIRTRLGFDPEEHRRLPDWPHALRYFTDLADDAGVLVMTSSIVDNNSHHRLDPEEFRGFALSIDHVTILDAFAKSLRGE